MIYPACLQKKDRGRDAIKTMRPLAFGEDHVRVSVEGMEALGRMLEKGEIDEAELESLEAWKEEKKEKNWEGNTVTRKKKKPMKISKEALEFAEGARHKQWDRIGAKKGEGEEVEEKEKEKEENEEEKNEEEDEALLEGEEEEEEIEEEENEEEEEEEEENENEMNEEEEEEENENENESIPNENESIPNENESIPNENESSPMEEESEDSDSMSPEKAEAVRQRRIALAREFMSTHILPPKLFRILQGDRNDSDSSDSDDSEEQTADVANEIVSFFSSFHDVDTRRGREPRRSAGLPEEAEGRHRGAAEKGDRRTAAACDEAEGRRHDEQGEGAKEELRDGQAERACEEKAEAEHSRAAAGREEAGAEIAGAGKEGGQEKKNLSRLLLLRMISVFILLFIITLGL